jgi:uncharacterized protein (DUF427 family)
MRFIMKAIWNGVVIAESDDGVVVEGNYYFPLESVEKQYLAEAQTQSVCPWKGVASYYDVVVDGKTNKDAAWYYPTPKPGAEQVKDRVAFWRGVRVVPSDQPAEEAGTGAGGVRELGGNR